MLLDQVGDLIEEHPNGIQIIRFCSIDSRLCNPVIALQSLEFIVGCCA